jgi:kynureninase
MAAIKASLDMFNEVGIKKLIEKSKKLTGYFEFLLKQLGEDTIRIITPENPDERGCQLSIQVLNANKSLYQKLTAAGVISDWREPDVIRCAPVPLYNSFEDMYHMVEKLKSILNE